MHLPLVLAAAWGVLAGRAVAVTGRSPHARRPAAAMHRWLRRTSVSVAQRVAANVVVRPFIAVVRDLRRRRALARVAHAVDRELALAVDLLAVAVGAGATPLLALDLAAAWSPAAVGSSFDAVVRRVRVGTSLPDALAVEGRRMPPLRPLTEALAPAIRLGSPLGPTLARIAADARAAYARRAAARARTVPVRLIFPLVLLVLPAFALLTVVPALVAGWRGI
jgi:Flp pilus assembly protein TadB